MKPELTAQILGMYVGRRADIELKNYYTAPDSDVITPALVGYFVLGDVDITPHLRRLESITEEECRELYRMHRGQIIDKNMSYKNDWWEDTDEFYVERLCIYVGSSKCWLYLLSKGFDLFGLIDAGLANEVSE